MLKGWNDKNVYEQMIHRNVAAIISDVVNQTMGGKGAMREVFSMWPLSEQDKNSGSQMTKEDMKAILREHNRILNEKKKKNG